MGLADTLLGRFTAGVGLVHHGGGGSPTLRNHQKLVQTVTVVLIK